MIILSVFVPGRAHPAGSHAAVKALCNLRGVSLQQVGSGSALPCLLSLTETTDNSNRSLRAHWKKCGKKSRQPWGTQSDCLWQTCSPTSMSQHGGEASWWCFECLCGLFSPKSHYVNIEAAVEQHSCLYGERRTIRSYRMITSPLKKHCCFWFCTKIFFKPKFNYAAAEFSLSPWFSFPAVLVQHGRAFAVLSVPWAAEVLHAACISASDKLGDN